MQWNEVIKKYCPNSDIFWALFFRIQIQNNFGTGTSKFSLSSCFSNSRTQVIGLRKYGRSWFISCVRMWLQARVAAKRWSLLLPLAIPNLHVIPPMGLYVWIMGYLVPHLGPGIAWPGLHVILIDHCCHLVGYFNRIMHFWFVLFYQMFSLEELLTTYRKCEYIKKRC